MAEAADIREIIFIFLLIKLIYCFIFLLPSSHALNNFYSFPPSGESQVRVVLFQLIKVLLFYCSLFMVCFYHRDIIRLRIVIMLYLSRIDFLSANYNFSSNSDISVDSYEVRRVMSDRSPIQGFIV